MIALDCEFCRFTVKANVPDAFTVFEVGDPVTVNALGSTNTIVGGAVSETPPD